VSTVHLASSSRRFLARRFLAWSSVLPLIAAHVGCGDDEGARTAASTGGETATGAGSGGAGGGVQSTISSGSQAQGGDGGGGDGGASSVSSSSTEGIGGGGGSASADPNADGPYTTAELTDEIAATDGTGMPLFAVYPTAGPAGGPYPVVVIAHGFQLPASQYASYARRLATHGFVAVTADYPAGFFGVSNVDNAADLLAALDWAGTTPPLAGVADAERAGMTGHSLGGKLALLAATLDARIRATITLDPVDGSMSCDPSECPDVSELMPLDIPTGFLGETLDASGGFQPCAPAADNYTTFYAGATAPSIEVTVLGANHMSFLDDAAGCGFTCSFCNPPTLDNATVNALSRAFVVAFYRRWLLGEVPYDAYLTGAEAQARYVDTGQVTIQSK
jgi:acetyl esterase/lipase